MFVSRQLPFWHGAGMDIPIDSSCRGGEGGLDVSEMWPSMYSFEGATSFNAKDCSL